MPEPREARSLIESAEQAAAAGNYASAEDLLREAATLQEQTLGPQHPDLANTLNNLGVVCEITDNPIDAEHYFRRACAIATASLPPDHPFVATSRKNLHDFCAARGRPVELPPSPPAVAAWLEAPAPAATLRESPQALQTEHLQTEEPKTEEPKPADLKTEDASPIPQTRSMRPLVVGSLAAAMLVVVILAVVRPWSRSSEEETTSPVAATAPSRDDPAPRSAPPPAEAIAPKQPAAAPQQPAAAPQQPAAKPAQPTRSGAEAIAAAPFTSAPPAGMPTVATAQLCTALRNWRCETSEREVAPGPMFFYTQVKSATATTIEHRWYQGDRLHRAVPLRIEANPGAGYRTYSRNTIGSERAGDWRVELRSADGTLLHEERFVIRQPVR